VFPPVPATLLTGLILLLALPLHAAQRIEGHAVRLADGVPVYREEHVVSEQSHRIAYVAPDGAALGELKLDYRCSDSAPDFEQHDRRTGTREGGRWRDGTYVLARTGSQDSGDARTATLRADGLPLVASSGFDRFIRASWDPLLRGEALVFRFAMPSRLAGIRLRARHEPRAPGPLTWFLIEPEQALLRVLADPIRVAYDGERRLAVYRGLSNLAGPDGRALQVEIRYFHAQTQRQDLAIAEPPPDASRITPRTHCPADNT
jgi:hypothetical protein